MNFGKATLGKMAKELGFVRDTFEKVCRLANVLKFMEGDSMLSDCLALKGGTAINLTIFNLPRLSVDIDWDFTKNLPREKMLLERQVIAEKISKYMVANGYALSAKTKKHYALDSFVFEYINAGGCKDNLKIEINYMLRCHIIPVKKREVELPWSDEKLTVLSVAPLEIFASKTVALLTRTAPRDLYDMNNLVRYKLFDESEQDLFRKCTVFYSAIGVERPPENFTFHNVGKVSAARIRSDLNPVLRRGERFDLEVAKKEVCQYLSEILISTKKEQMFWKNFAEGIYNPSLVFAQSDELNNIKEHPMALWKCRNEE